MGLMKTTDKTIYIRFSYIKNEMYTDLSFAELWELCLQNNVVFYDVFNSKRTYYYLSEMRESSKGIEPHIQFTACSYSSSKYSLKVLQVEKDRIFWDSRNVTIQ